MSSVNHKRHQNALIIFIKNPEKGKVKTRIAKGSDHDTAFSVYQRLLRHTQSITQDLDATKYLFYSDCIADDNWSEETYIKKVQRGLDLGERMLDAFIEVMSYHKYVAIIGSDCIYLKPEHINNAFQRLRSHDCVLGPSTDGGYYLLGMKTVYKELFINIPWSSGNELKTTLGIMNDLSLNVAKLEALTDIDHIEDWKEYLLSTED